MTSFIFINNFALSAISNNKKVTRHQNYLIQSSFKVSKKIWGTYNQIFETGYKLNKKGKKIQTNRVKNPIANILFKQGKIFFIRPNHIKNSISIEVLGLPYKKIRRRTYRLKTEGHKVKLYSMFKGHIETMIRKGLYRKENISTISIEDIEFKNATCSRKRKVYKCDFPIMIFEKEIFTKPSSPKEIGPKEIKIRSNFSFKKNSPSQKRFQQALKRYRRRRTPSSKIFRSALLV